MIISALVLILDVLSFNNSYSWMRGKKILYHVEVIVPDTLTDFAKTAVIDDTLT